MGQIKNIKLHIVTDIKKKSKRVKNLSNQTKTMAYYSESAYEHDPYAEAPPAKQQKVDQRFSDLDEIVTLQEKVFFPVDKHPGYNFVGPLLGPSGSILKELTKRLRAKIAILGKGSMKDKKKEEKLALSEEAEHAHLKEPLHVLIDIKAPRAEAHHRMANALTTLYTFMVPPPQEQQPQQEIVPGPYAAYGGGYSGGDYGFVGHPHGRGGPPPRGGRGGPRGGPRGRGFRGGPRGRGY